MAYRENGNEIEIRRATKFPEVLVVTPLLPIDEVSSVTRKTIQRNHVKYFWIESMGDNNIPTNYQIGIDWARKNIPDMPEHCIMIDNDIELGRHMLDRLHEKLKSSDNWCGYAYASFEFKGSQHHSFPAVPFSPERLMQGNYISSNSMFKTDVIEEVGLVTDDKYKRLLDWAFLIKCLSMGYYGIPVPEAKFVAHMEEGDISAGSSEDYKIKAQRVFDDFIKPLMG